VHSSRRILGAQGGKLSSWQGTRFGCRNRLHSFGGARHAACGHLPHVEHLLLLWFVGLFLTALTGGGSCATGLLNRYRFSILAGYPDGTLVEHHIVIGFYIPIPAELI